MLKKGEKKRYLPINMMRIHLGKAMNNVGLVAVAGFVCSESIHPFTYFSRPKGSVISTLVFLEIHFFIYLLFLLINV